MTSSFLSLTSQTLATQSRFIQEHSPALADTQGRERQLDGKASQCRNVKMGIQTGRVDEDSFEGLHLQQEWRGYAQYFPL